MCVCYLQRYLEVGNAKHLPLPHAEIDHALSFVDGFYAPTTFIAGVIREDMGTTVSAEQTAMLTDISNKLALMQQLGSASKMTRRGTRQALAVDNVYVAV